MKRVLAIWLAVGLLTLVLAGASFVLAPDGGLTAVFTVFFVLWVAISSAVLVWYFWRWLTYRVSTRLLLSYLLVGVMPFIVSAALAGFVLYMVMGQYTSVRFSSEMERLEADLQRDCHDILAVYRSSGEAAASVAFREVAGRARYLAPRVLWNARFDGLRLGGDEGLQLPEPSWMTGETSTLVLSGDMIFMLVGTSGLDGSYGVSALVPLDADTAFSIDEALWFDVYFTPLDEDDELGEDEAESANGGGGDLEISSDSGSVAAVRFNDETLSVDDMWPPWPENEQGILNKPWIYWFRLALDTRDLASGESAGTVITLLRTSPMNVWKDFTSSKYELGTHLWGALVGVAMFFGVLYGLALLIAATMIISITRSTARLSKGAKAVERGQLDYRIPVKRHDQLGDLAASFNRMTQSVEDMLDDVAEKERLARELELAREIQESLLPDRHLRHGSLGVHAVFRPAAAVGGDYFDIFPLGGERLLVVVGDVAGHGLHAGLLMASLKATVAALVREGYTGTDLVHGVNELLLERGAGPTMATLAVVDLDLESGILRLTNAGHPPPYLIEGGRAQELMASSLPLGSPLSVPHQIERPFPEGARLLLYSDGLVEATDQGGEPFSYERLAALVDGSAGKAAGELETELLTELDRFVGDRPLADDLTLLVVERGPKREPADHPPVS